MQKTKIEVETAGTNGCFHLHTHDYKKWFYLETRPEPTITDLSGYPAPSIFNIVHKLPDGRYFICGIKAFKNLPIRARETMLTEQLKPHDIHLTCQDTTNVLMGIPIIGIMPHKVKEVYTARKTFEDVVRNATFLGQYTLPGWKKTSIRKYWLNGNPYFLLSAFTIPLAVWDVSGRTLINAARTKKIISAFYKWIEEHKSDNLPLKEVQI